MEKIIIFEIKDSVYNLRSQITDAQKRLNNAFAEFDALKLGVPIESKYFLLNEAPEDIIYRIYRDRLPKTDVHTGLELDRDAIMRTVKLPDCKKLYTACQNLGNRTFIDEKLNFLDLESGRLVFNEETFQDHCDLHYRIITHRPEVKELYDEFRDLENRINKLQAKARFVSIDGKSGSPILQPFTVVNMVSGEIKFKDIEFKSLMKSLQS